MRNITGERFGKWTAIRFSERRGSNYFWLCRCSCGTEKQIKKSSLISGKTRSCGCSMAKDITGNRYNEWEAIRFAKVFRNRHYWICRCSCGTERQIEKSHLVGGKNYDCGCKKKERRKNEKLEKCEPVSHA